MLQSEEALRLAAGTWEFCNLQNSGVQHFAEPPGRSKAALATPEASAQSLWGSAWSDIAIIIIVQHDFVDSCFVSFKRNSWIMYVLKLHCAMLNAWLIHLLVLQPA